MSIRESSIRVPWLTQPDAVTRLTLHFLVFKGGALLTEYDLQALVHQYEIERPWIMCRSRSYFCPECGEIWARILCVGYTFNHPILRRCAQHWCPREPEAGQFIEYANAADPVYPKSLYYHDALFLAQKEIELDHESESEG